MDYFFKRKIINLFFPNRCPICNGLINANDRFCPECTDSLKTYDGDFHIDGVSAFCACFEYDKNIKPSVFLLKNGICGNSAHAFGMYLAEKLEKSGISQKTDIIIPVPMSADSLKKRGYNQSELISQVVGTVLGLPVRCVVKKVKSTRQQKTLGATDRKSNLKNAFEVSESEAVTGKNVLIIDDICTTGSTLAEISALLAGHNANEIFCASVCKVLKE